MKLIRESIEDVTTEKNKENAYFIRGITMQAGIVNRNKRLYPKPYVEREIERYLKEQVSAKRAFGELGHPDTTIVNPDRVSHFFTKLRLEGNDVYSDSKVMDTPMGKIVKVFIDEDRVFGLSSRALGSLKRKGDHNVVQEDFRLITPGDIVIDPSAPGAFVAGIKEGMEYDFIDGVIIENVTSHINKNYKSMMTRREKEGVLLKAFDIILSDFAEAAAELKKV